MTWTLKHEGRKATIMAWALKERIGFFRTFLIVLLSQHISKWVFVDFIELLLQHNRNCNGDEKCWDRRFDVIIISKGTNHSSSLTMEKSFEIQNECLVFRFSAWIENEQSIASSLTFYEKKSFPTSTFSYCRRIR